MPREITILSRGDHDLFSLAEAAEAIRGAAAVREIDGGSALQVTTATGVPVLTVYPPRLMPTAGEVARLLPDAPAVDLPTWWCDAVAPLGDEGEIGVRVALQLAVGMGAVCVVAD